MSDDASTSGRWSDRISQAGHERWAARIHEAMAAPERFRQRSGLMELVNLVRLARTAHQRCDTQDLSLLVELSFEALLRIGAAGLKEDDAEEQDENFRGHNDFLREALQLIDILEARGADVSPHYLAAARFQAGVLNGSAVRLRYIERAVQTAQSPGHRANALLTLARCHVDSSRYTRARKVLRTCADLIRDKDLQNFWPDFERTTGLTYYYSQPALARRHFQAAVDRSALFPADPQAQQARATAQHFLGRLAADGGDFHQAITLMAAADRQSEGYLANHGFYHIRVAEILVDHGTLQETEHHLQQAIRNFDNVDHNSNGKTLLAGTRARLHRRTGNLDAASSLLKTYIAKARNDKEPRVELILLAEQLRLSITQRALTAMPGILLRAGYLYLRYEFLATLRSARQLLTVLRRALQFLRPAPATRDTATLSCPCGENHILSEAPAALT